ncbi:MAG: hypothetical protein K2P20_01640 [Oscillospiraceae bacterium]|nr:hypothetical protein [Oscillospiraceae bacterium]
MDFKEILYNYISEHAYSALIKEEAYQKAASSRRAAADRLSDTLSAEQQQLLEEFTAALFAVCELESYYYFCEALHIVRGLLAV